MADRPARRGYDPAADDRAGGRRCLPSTARSTAFLPPLDEPAPPSRREPRLPARRGPERRPPARGSADPQGGTGDEPAPAAERRRRRRGSSDWCTAAALALRPGWPPPARRPPTRPERVAAAVDRTAPVPADPRRGRSRRSCRSRSCRSRPPVRPAARPDQPADMAPTRETFAPGAGCAQGDPAPVGAVEAHRPPPQRVDGSRCRWRSISCCWWPSWWPPSCCGTWPTPSGPSSPSRSRCKTLFDLSKFTIHPSRGRQVHRHRRGGPGLLRHVRQRAGGLDVQPDQRPGRRDPLRRGGRGQVIGATQFPLEMVW